MLRLLSGRTHEVLTAVVADGRPRCRSIRNAPSMRVWKSTAVEFAPLDKAEIDWYVATGEPSDKAGAYAIQGLASRFVTRIAGLLLERGRAAGGTRLRDVHPGGNTAILTGVSYRKSLSMSHKAAKIGVTTLVLATVFGILLYTTLGESMQYLTSTWTRSWAARATGAARSCRSMAT